MEITKAPRSLITIKKQQSIFSEWINNHLSFDTKKSYVSVLKSFERFLHSHKIQLTNINQINRKMAIAYRDSLVSRSLSNKTICLHLSTLSSVINWFILEGQFDNKPNPISQIKRPSNKELKRVKFYLSDDEIQRMLNSFKHLHLKTAFMIMAHSGQRAGSVLRLQVKNVSVFNDRLVISLKTKGAKTRVVALTKATEGYLKELLLSKSNPDDFLFTGRGQNKPLSLRSFNKSLKASVKRANIKKNVSSHTMRRSLISKMMLNDVPLDKIVSCVSFHQDINMLYHYRSSETYDLEKNPILEMENSKIE
tara:strand:+ start:4879 stop:5802 length:924 start_codon:yes stop_codon:yes gene_type:complete